MTDPKRKGVLVTGGAGLVGSQIIDQRCDNRIRGRNEALRRAASRGPVRMIQDDLRDPELTASLIQVADIVLHQAALRTEAVVS